MPGFGAKRVSPVPVDRAGACQVMAFGVLRLIYSDQIRPGTTQGRYQRHAAPTAPSSDIAVHGVICSAMFACVRSTIEAVASEIPIEPATLRNIVNNAEASAFSDAFSVR